MLLAARQNGFYGTRLWQRPIRWLRRGGGRTMMKELLYDWLGLNEWLFKMLYAFSFPYLHDIW